MKKPVAKMRTPRPSKFDQIAEAISRDYAHQNSLVVQSRVRVLRCELDEIDLSVNNLTAALANARDRRAKVEAQIRGLTAVVAKR